MKKSLRNIFTVIILIAALVLVSSSAFAATPLKPYFDFGTVAGGYSYNDNIHELTFTNLKVLGVVYGDGSSGFSDFD